MYNVVEDIQREYRRGTLIDNENYSIHVEYFVGEVFLHIDVYNFSPSIFKQIKEDFEYIKQYAYNEGFDYVHAYTPNLKFSKMLGDVEHIDTVDLNGKEVEVIRWALQ